MREGEVMAKRKGVSGVIVAAIVAMVAVVGAGVAYASGLFALAGGPDGAKGQQDKGKDGGASGPGSIFQKEFWEAGEDGRNAWDNLTSWITGK